MNNESPAPRISIIIATWNAAGTLNRCLASIFIQEFPDWELLISDGGSTDGTKDIIQKHSDRIAYWHSRPDKGIYDAWNQALSRARGEYICFLGSDDSLSSPRTLAEMFASIGGAHYDLVTSRGRLINSSGLPTHVLGTSWENANLPRRIRVCHPGLLHHHSLFVRYGKFNTNYRIAADFEFLLRVSESVSTFDLPVVTVDVQDGGISRSQFWRRIREYRSIHAASPRVGPVKAWLYWADKAWRRPIALLLGLPH